MHVHIIAVISSSVNERKTDLSDAILSCLGRFNNVILCLYDDYIIGTNDFVFSDMLKFLHCICRV